MFQYWEVGNDGRYYYTLCDMSMDEIKNEFDIQDSDFKFIERDEWTAENYAEILSCELENANHHSWTELPHVILSVLDKSDISKEQMDSIMRKISESIYEMI